MLIEENKAFVQKFLDELYNKGNLALADEVVAPSLLRGAMKNAVVTLRTILPDLRLAVEELISEEDKIVARCTMSGTYSRRWLGSNLVSRSIEVSYIGIYRVNDNQVKAFWFLRDELSLLRQLGLLGALLVFAEFGKRLRGH